MPLHQSFLQPETHPVFCGGVESVLSRSKLWLVVATIVTVEPKINVALYATHNFPYRDYSILFYCLREAQHAKKPCKVNALMCRSAGNYEPILTTPSAACLKSKGHSLNHNSLKILVAGVSLTGSKLIWVTNSYPAPTTARAR